MKPQHASGLRAALAPRSVAIVGASDNPHKVGGRPILYMKRYGYGGVIYPINPARAEVQGLKAYADLAALPEAPELVIVAVAGEEAVRAVEACAARGAKVAVVMASGFGELGAEGRALQDRMLAAARASGMRLVGPNCQGLANFATGAVANFSTVFHEIEARDGPVAIVSQSGACSQAIYALARQRGLDVRHVHATGNEADVTVADLALEIAGEDGVRLMLLYMEAIPKPEVLAAAAERARERDLPIVAVKAGRTESGRRAASSHTGALASEDRVVDAFFARHAIWRVPDPHALVAAGPLYLKGWRPRAARFVALSNSGASCVMAADAAEELGLPLAQIGPAARSRLAAVLPGFATATNPLDVTGALLGSPDLFARALPILAHEVDSELAMVALPVAGTGYDVPGFARDFAAHAQATGRAVVLAAPQPEVRAEFDRVGLPAYAREREAIGTLAQLAAHSALMRKGPRPQPQARAPALPQGERGFLNEAQSLALLAAAGIAAVEHRLCRSEDEVRAAVAALGAPVALKACSRDAPHKTELGLVALDIDDASAAAAQFGRQSKRLAERGARFEGVVVARMAKGRRELALGARVDPLFGPVVLVGDGGIYLEALKDFQLLLAPFSEDDVLGALGRLRIAPLLAGVRGQRALDTEAFARMAVRLGDAMLAWRGSIASVDVNPVMLFEKGRGALAVDALVERA
ncbi:MAG TPA: acetate--CoA ligase family protein [Burkholderiales bacterium]|nr:acetate--CoA ligase family protein [Burkholderiales bacterium]